MVSIVADKLSLTYRVRRPLTLARQAAALHRGRVESVGRTQYVKALTDVSFALEAGDRLGLVGANGAGKTTLLKVLYGIYSPTSGSVAVDGRVDALFNINLGFRREATGRRNIVLRGLINGWTERDIGARMDDIIAFSELGDFIDLPYKTYSQGMAARLAFAVATSCEPQILLMDEWIGAGDTKFQEKAHLRMQDLAERAGIIVLASHNHTILKRTCNKILEMENGSVKCLMPAEEWYKQK